MSFDLELWHLAILGVIACVGCIITGFWALDKDRTRIHIACVVLAFFFGVSGMICGLVDMDRNAGESHERYRAKTYKGDWRLLYDFFRTHDHEEDALAIEDFAKKHPECPDEILYLDTFTGFKNNLNRENTALFQKHFGDCIVVGWDKKPEA